MRAGTVFTMPRLGGAVLLLAGAAFAQATSDTLELPAVITTGSRTPTAFKDAPVKVSVVGEREMRNNGAQRLGDVLNEQTGLTVVHDSRFGAGIQVQGLDPDYTLILVDGEPMVGREGGILDLDRLMVAGVEQVEILKGPSSSLYGSEALGGVINLVTRRPSEPFSGSFQSRYGTHGELDLGGNASTKRGNAELSMTANRLSSEGYDQDPASRGQTAPAYENFTLQPKAAYAWGDATRLTVSGRFFREDQRNEANYVLGTDTVPSRDHQVLRDQNLYSTFEHAFSPALSWTLKGYVTRYVKSSALNAESGDSSLSGTLFGQRFYKAESFVNMSRGNHALVLGGGAALELVEADYVAGGAHEAPSGFAFAQEDWKPDARFTLQTSARFDTHADYESHLSPKVAGLYRPYPWLALRASVGNGFKAPTSQELYLDFTNAQVGYTVFGAAGAREGLERLRQQDQVEGPNLQTGEFGTLRPENSWAYNAGAEVSAGRVASAKVNVFRNNVRDLIESAPIAVKTNNQSVYTYFNLNHIHTWGVETEGAFKPARWLTLGAGYQYLVAEDEDVLSRIEAGTLYKPRDVGPGNRPVQRVEYGGLFNRSRHTANLKAEFDTGKPGFLATLRGIYHGRYGFGDQNGNGILDSDKEYADGYLELNATLTQKITRFASLQAGATNLLDQKAPAPTPTLPGRLFYAGIQLQYF